MRGQSPSCSSHLFGCRVLCLRFRLRKSSLELCLRFIPLVLPRNLFTLFFVLDLRRLKAFWRHRVAGLLPSKTVRIERAVNYGRKVVFGRLDGNLKDLGVPRGGNPLERDLPLSSTSTTTLLPCLGHDRFSPFGCSACLWVLLMPYTFTSTQTKSGVSSKKYRVKRL